MPSVFRDKRKYGAPSVGGNTSENAKRLRKAREEELDDAWARENVRRGGYDESYVNGRRKPLIEED